MGSRLSGSSRLIGTLAGIALLALPPSVLAQDGDDEAQRLFDAGLEAYRQRDYSAAIEALSQSYQLDPRPETLFAWAQAERLNDNCAEAVVLYRRFLDHNPTLKQSQLVRENLELCEAELAATRAAESKPAEPAVKPPATTAPAPAAPTNADRHGETPVVQLGLIIAGAAGLGTSAGLFIASRGNRDGANAAERLEDFERLNDRADSQQTLGLMVGAGSLALVAGGIAWAVLAGDDEPSPLAVGPIDGGGLMVTLSRPLF